MTQSTPQSHTNFEQEVESLFSRAKAKLEERKEELINSSQNGRERSLIFFFHFKVSFIISPILCYFFCDLFDGDDSYIAQISK